MVASVARKGETLRLVIKSPLISPTSAPSASAPATAPAQAVACNFARLCQNAAHGRPNPEKRNDARRHRGRRRAAGQALASLLLAYRRQPDTIVLALPLAREAPWLAVLMLFVLSGVFAHGARLRTDLEGTV